jgi:hypothetical protein
MKPRPSLSIAGLLRGEGDVRAEHLQHLGAARGGGHRAPHVLRHPGAGRRGDEGGAGRDVEGMRGVAAGAAGVDQVAVVLHLDVRRQLAHHLRRRGDLADGFLLDAQADDEAGDLRRRQLAAHDLAHDVQHLVVEHLAVLDGALDGFGRGDLLHGVPSGSLDEIFQHFVAMLRKQGLGVELHPFHRQAAMAQAHDLAVLGVGGDVQAGGQAGALDDQGVVARRNKIVFDFLENSLPVVPDARSLAVHHLLCAYYPAAERLPDRLVTEAHAEQRHAAGHAPDQLQGDARLVR